MFFGQGHLVARAAIPFGPSWLAAFGDPKRTLRYLIKAVALLLCGAVYLYYRRYYVASELAGEDPPKPLARRAALGRPGHGHRLRSWQDGPVAVSMNPHLAHTTGALAEVRRFRDFDGFDQAKRWPRHPPIRCCMAWRPVPR